MDDPVSELAAKVKGLAESLREIEARVAAIESGARAEIARPAAPRSAAPAVPVPDAPASSLPGVIAIVGRSFLVFAGAFFVRALTDAGVLPQGAGVALGLLYASVWLILAGRAGSAGRRQAATAYGFTATAIVCPLVFEATTRFGVFPAAGAAAVLFGLALAALAISSRWNLAALAWSAVLGTLATAIALLVATHAIVTFGALLLLLAASCLAVSLRTGWAGLPWPAALAADLVAVEAAFIAGRPDGLPEAYAGLATGSVVALALSLPLPFLAVVLWSAAIARREPSAFEVFQTAAGLLIALTVVARLGPSAGLPKDVVSVGVLATAAALYVAALRWTASRTSSLVPSSAALVVAVVASRLSVPSAALTPMWAAMGLVAVVLTPSRPEEEAFALQGALLFVAAAFDSGLLAASRDAFLAGAAPAAAFRWPAMLVLGFLILSTGVVARRSRFRPGGRTGRAALLVLAALSVVGIGVIAERGLARVCVAAEDPSRIAAVRTAVLAAAALGLGLCRRVPSLGGLSWLAYPTLAAGGLKLLAEDLPHGRPATLFVAFALYGAALIGVPRLLRAGAAASASQ